MEPPLQVHSIDMVEKCISGLRYLSYSDRLQVLGLQSRNADGYVMTLY